MHKKRQTIDGNDMSSNVSHFKEPKFNKKEHTYILETRNRLIMLARFAETRRYLGEQIVRRARFPC